MAVLVAERPRATALGIDIPPPVLAVFRIIAVVFDSSRLLHPPLLCLDEVQTLEERTRLGISSNHCGANVRNSMKKTSAVSCLVAAIFLLLVPAWAGDKDKDEDTFKNGAQVLKEMLDSNVVPSTLLEKANCVMVLPGVKKFGIGIGGSGGRGPMTCRAGKKFDGAWTAPAMFKIGGVSAGLQIGGSSTDFVLLIMSEKGVDTILNGKTKLGNEASVAAGPSGATAGSPVNADVVTYGRAKGLFAGVSLSGASLEADNDANKRLYEKAVSAREIVTGGTVKTTPGGEPLVTLLTDKIGTGTKSAAKPEL